MLLDCQKQHQVVSADSNSPWHSSSCNMVFLPGPRPLRDPVLSCTMSSVSIPGATWLISKVPLPIVMDILVMYRKDLIVISLSLARSQSD